LKPGEMYEACFLYGVKKNVSQNSDFFLRGLVINSQCWEKRSELWDKKSQLPCCGNTLKDGHEKSNKHKDLHMKWKEMENVATNAKCSYCFLVPCGHDLT